MREPMRVDDVNAPSTSSYQPRLPSQRVCNHPNPRYSVENVYRILARREIAPRTKRSPKRLWAENYGGRVDSLATRFPGAKDANQALTSWVEAESLRHLSAKYCPLLPPPRSTIAAAFSPDGKTLASTHGDHTVKIVDCRTGNCLKVLSGHRRTPWVVRFHPLCPDILASGSLDHELRLWDAKTAECIGSRDFYRPIASIAFHAQGEMLAVASGHKLYIWHYNRRGEGSAPAIVLKTRRSLRAVHFHPHAAPFLLTAEVNDIDGSDSSVSIATSHSYPRYPPPFICFANGHSSGRSNLTEELPLMSFPNAIWPPLAQDDRRTSLHHTGATISMGSFNQRRPSPNSSSVRLLTYSTPSGQYELLLSPVEANNSSSLPEELRANVNVVSEMEINPSDSGINDMEIQHEDQSNQIFPFVDPAHWELPFLQGWLIGQNQAEGRMIRPEGTFVRENFIHGEVANQAFSSAMPTGATFSQSGQSTSRIRLSRSQASDHSGGSAFNEHSHMETGTRPSVSRFQSQLATTLTAAAAAELPCTVKLRIWPHDINNPSAPLDAGKCRLTIPHVVLCSEMGSHFSPCGRLLAACVACMLPNGEGDSGLSVMANLDVSRVSTSPTRHPISGHQVMYELRIYSLEESTFGSVLASRAIRAAHCLTSIQFSPTSEHLLLAYGRRHNSLLKSIVIDGESTYPVYTILEVYRVSDMELVSVLPSSEDEVNVACFHPTVGGGLVYGTKEGKLRILQYDSSHDVKYTAYSEENMVEVLPTYAPEC